MLPERDMSLAGGLALGAVDGGGIGELDLVSCVRRRNDPGTTLTLEREGAVVTDGRDGPGVAVSDAEVAVVASRSDPVTDPQSLAGVRHVDTSVVDMADSDEAVADGSVQRSGLLASVSHQ